MRTDFEQNIAKKSQDVFVTYVKPMIVEALTDDPDNVPALIPALLVGIELLAQESRDLSCRLGLQFE